MSTMMDLDIGLSSPHTSHAPRWIAPTSLNCLNWFGLPQHFRIAPTLLDCLTLFFCLTKLGLPFGVIDFDTCEHLVKLHIEELVLVDGTAVCRYGSDESRLTTHAMAFGCCFISIVFCYELQSKFLLFTCQGHHCLMQRRVYS